jgi:hypothetical protein
MVDGGGDRDALLLAGGPTGDLDQAVGQVAAADGQAERDAGQLGVLELDPRPLLTVIEEGVDPSRQEIGVQGRRRRPGGLVAGRQQDDRGLGRGDLDRPGQAGVVVVRLGDGRDGPMARSTPIP